MSLILSANVMLKKATLDDSAPIELKDASLVLMVTLPFSHESNASTATAISLPLLLNTTPKSAVSPASRMPLPLSSFFIMTEEYSNCLP